MADDPGAEHHAGIRERLEDELRKYLVVSAYLWVCFALLLFYKSTILVEAGQHAVPLGLAVAKALILGKFLLLGEAAGVGTRLRSSNLLRHILLRTVLLLLVLLLLTAVEEVVVALVHGHSLREALGVLDEFLRPETAATILLMLLVLLPLVTVIETSRALGPGVLRRLLLERRGPER